MDTPNRFQRIKLEPLSEEFPPIQIPEWARQMVWDAQFCFSFTDAELRRLHFTRWLVRTGRLSEWS